MNELKIKLFSYDHRLLDSSNKKLIKTVKGIGANVKGPIPLPTNKEIFTICRSPHVNKPSMEHFHRRTHKRLLIITNTSGESIQKLNTLSQATGVEIKISL